MFAIFVASFFLTPLIGSEFVPEDDNGSTNVRIQTPIGSSLEYTNGKAQQVEGLLREIPEIKRVSKYVNKTGAWFDLEIGKKKDRKRGKKEIDDDIRGRLAKVAGLDVNIGWNRPIQVFVLGPDIAELDRISQQVIKKMKAIKGIVDIDSSYKPTTPTLDVVVNRDLASDVGVSMAQITATTRAMIGGEPAGQWEGPDGENHQILVRLPQAGAHWLQRHEPHLCGQQHGDARGLTAHGAAAPDRRVPAGVRRAPDRPPQPAAPDPHLHRRVQGTPTSAMCRPRCASPSRTSRCRRATSSSSAAPRRTCRSPWASPSRRWRWAWCSST